jgi:GTP-binding protein
MSAEDLPLPGPLGAVEQWETDDDREYFDDRAIEALVAEEFADLEPDALPEDAESWPVVAVVGRPNVGKSTLVNRILGRREAVVQDTPGVTRDRVYYPANWSGRDFILVDTGGWVDRAQGLSAQIAAQAQRAAAEADVVLFIVDATVGATDEDEAVVRLLRRSGAPVLLVANKVDDARTEADAAALWGLGVGEPYPVSALHGRGSGDLLDAVLAAMPEVGRGRPPAGPHRVALVGKPNVGKSSLLNRLAREQRAVVDSVAGTTVDPVDEVIVLDGQEWLFVDTAGLRRRVKEASGQEYYASLRTRSAIERAEVAVMLIDAREPVAEQDLRVLQMVVEAGRGLVLAFNKWDEMDEERRRYLEREIERDLHHVAWAPRVNVSALTGRRVDAIAPAVRRSLAGWSTRVSTGRLNAFLKEVGSAHPHPVRGGKQPRILFGTQASVAPPTIVLFTTGELEAGYRRFIERRLREAFGFEGTPIRIDQRIREKRQWKR